MENLSDKNRIFNEYVIADRKMHNNGMIDFTLIPTYIDGGKLPKKVSIHYSYLDKFKREEAFYRGGLVTLTKKGTIRPVQYVLRKCDVMLVTGAYDISDEIRKLKLMGKKFGAVPISLSRLSLPLWETKFFDTKRGDIVLVQPENDSNNKYKILRNFTTEKMITEFFENQR